MKTNPLWLVLLFLSLTNIALADTEYLNSADSSRADLPFSEAVRVDNMLYLSGVIGTIPGSLELASNDIEGQTRQTMENINALLQKYGSSMDKIVKCLVMIDDMQEWPRMNAIYITYFDSHKPARSAFGADGLALGAKLEIECMATID
ncbi:MAG: enamine deaminase RidA [SAR86 cluster bacterium]|uniref:Enamine deaminase RidA n=1 Tax=SAR86 cluster bacterium TaxID=2030880 RepID=A0A2A5C7C8_9GAMM|nr:MAG: enamine deaminase RidA [SAR86 cluster bacterium]